MNNYNNSLVFNRRIICTKNESVIFQLTNKIFQELNRISSQERLRKIALNNILCNVLIAHHNNHYLAISKRPESYSYYKRLGMHHYTYRLIIGWVNLLVNQEYIRQIPGFYNVETQSGRVTRLALAEQIITLIKELQNSYHQTELMNYSPPVILKDSDKNVVPYSKSGRIREMIRFMEEYNEFIEEFQIKFPIRLEMSLNHNFSYYYPFNDDKHINIYHILRSYTQIQEGTNRKSIPLLVTKDGKRLSYRNLQAQLYRVFNNGKFSDGGRFYGSEYQQLNEDDRSKILIDDSPISEVDYSSFHLNMLYHKTNTHFDGDPYSKVTNIPELRPLLKAVNLIAINSESPAKALKALRYEINKSFKLRKLKRLYRVDEKDLLRKFESTHSRISNYFYSGIGIKLQNLDSQIAEDVLRYFTRREIPCLCVHDSFLVPQQHKEELKVVMNSFYKNRLGFDAKLK